MRQLRSIVSARVLATVARPAALCLLLGFFGHAAMAADPPKKVDCSKYTGTEREACEKMMGKKK